MSNQIVNAVKFIGKIAGHTSETVTDEAALQIKINNKAYTVTMRSAGHDVPLSIGLLFTEGIIRSMKEIDSIKESPSLSSNVNSIVDIKVPEHLVEGKNIFNRTIASSSSCGICGKTDLCDLSTVSPFENIPVLDITLLPDFFLQMQLHQNTFGLTGGSHAAAIFANDNTLLSVKEDIGRHNAVDKVIGECLIDSTLSEAKVLCVSGRVSFEIVTKCLKAKIPFLAAVSAPSNLAVSYCQEMGITLIAFCRGDKATVYTCPENVLQYHHPISTPT
jgi:FdhD protein